MLQELVRDKGVMEATRVLDINYKTLTSSMKTGHLSKRTLLNGEGCAAPAQRERNVQLGKRLDELEEELRSALKELRTALEGQREEHASHGVGSRDNWPP